MFRIFSEVAKRTQKIILTTACLFVVVALFFDYWLNTCPTEGGFFDSHITCAGTYYEPFQITATQFMVWFGLTGIPLILLWLGWEKAKELWKSGFFNPKSRYFRFHGKIVLFVEVVACFVLAFAVFPYLMMHFDPIYAFFMRTVVKWLEPSFDFMMHITSMFFDSVFGFVMDMLVKLISVL